MVCMGLPDEMQDTCWDLTDAHRRVGNLKKTFIPWNYPLLMNLDGLTLATLGVRPFLFILCNSTCAHAAKQELQTSDAGRWVTCRNRITTNCPAGDCTLEFFSKWVRVLIAINDRQGKLGDLGDSSFKLPELYFKSNLTQPFMCEPSEEERSTVLKYQESTPKPQNSELIRFLGFPDDATTFLLK